MDDDSAVLSGIRIVDFSQYLAGPLATMLLADFGAEVIRVDPPGGPRLQHPANACLHRGKQAIELDLKTEIGLLQAKELIASADIVVEGFRPGVMDRLGLRSDELRRAHPGLIWCSLPGFSRTDRRAGLQGWEGVVCSAAALYPRTQYAKPNGVLFSAIPYASNFAGLIAAHSMVSAIWARKRTGRGDAIEVALFDAAAEAIAMTFEEPRAIGIEPMWAVHHTYGVQNQAEGRLYKCRDGRFVRRCIPLRGVHNFWDRYMPEGLKNDASDEAARRAEALLEELFLTKDAEEWERIGQTELRAAFGTHLSSREWMQDRHAQDSGTVVRVEDPEFGSILTPGYGVKVDGKPTGSPRPRHLAGADTDAVLAALASGQREHTPATAVGAAARSGELPLAGIRMVDFTSLVAGPTTGRILAQYGAEVIKISRTKLAKGDFNLTSDEPFAFVGHRTTGLGKKAMFLELTAEGSDRVVERLIASSDILHHNFIRGVAERYGIGRDDLHKQRPELIYSTVRVHGSGGWREGWRGHEQIAQSASGMTVRFGGAEAPAELQLLNNDYATAHLSVLGVFLALLERERSGRGVEVESALSRTATLCQIAYMVDDKAGPVVEPTGPQAVGWSAWNRLYDCSDGPIFLAAMSDGARQAAAEVLGLSDLADMAAGAVEAAIATALQGHCKVEICEKLQAAGVAAHPYCEADDLLADQTRIERGLMVYQPHPGLQPGYSIGSVVTFESRPEARPKGSVLPGWHTFEILEELGFSQGEIGELVDTEVVAGTPEPGTQFIPV